MLFGKNRQNEQRDLIIAYKRVFGSPEGKKVYFDLLNFCSIITGHKNDPLLEGRREVGLRLLEKCNINLAEFDKLLKGDANEFTE